MDEIYNLNYIFMTLIIILITSCIFLIISPDRQCEPQIVYKLVSEPVLNTQFDEKNIPSIVYNDMFNESSPWIGGYQLGIGKTYTVEREEKKLNI